jgi:sugar phosphate isomerase/epimerase
MIQRYPELRNDRRFKNICDDDLKKKDFLRVEDFIFDFINYFHISDSLIWTEEDGISSLKKFLYTENLPIGHGNINYSEIFKDISGNKVMIMEINSENGSHINNISQLKAVEFFRSHYN